MRQQLTSDRVEALWGCPVLDCDGHRVGSLEEVFYDSEDFAPEWIGVGTGVLGRKLVPVPVGGATELDHAITVAYSGALVRDAPELRHDFLDQHTLQALHAYYGCVGSDSA